ncbi:MAG: dienelactone hydrolase family protein [Gammaproteobacteria bacterium]
MSREQVEIRTADGICKTWVFTPGGAGRWPAVIFFMDGLAIRPLLLDMAERIAADGYVVLLPDMFYRAGPYEPMDPKVVLATPDIRKTLGHLFASSDNARGAQDTGAFLAYLDTRTDVLGRKVGTTGYCMGGGWSLTAAGTYPDRIAVAASFHGGGLASDSPLSPHLLAPKMKGFIYVAGADQDNSYPPEMHAQLEKALTDAGVPHRCEIWPGALHGWTMADFPIYKQDDAERHFRELRALYADHLR